MRCQFFSFLFLKNKKIISLICCLLFSPECVKGKKIKLCLMQIKTSIHFNPKLLNVICDLSRIKFKSLF